MSDVTVKLTVNGHEFPINYKMLDRIARTLPLEKHFTELAQALLGLGLPSITRHLVSNDALTDEDRDAIWKTDDLDFRRELAENSTFRANLTDAQAEEIIKMNDVEILKSIGENVEELYPATDEQQATRLSEKMADELVSFIVGHTDTLVRRSLAENTQAPAKFRPGIGEMIRKGMKV